MLIKSSGLFLVDPSFRKTARFASSCGKLGPPHTESTQHDATRSPPPLSPI